jgi:hypothetical protein
MKGNTTIRVFVLLSFWACFSACQEETKMKESNNPVRNTNIEGDIAEVQQQIFSNPTVFMGTDFGNFMRTLYGIGDVDRMIAFTSSDAIKRFGSDALRDHYQQLDLRMEMKLLSATHEDHITLLHYECIDKATKIVRRLPVIIENDSVKVHIHQLDRKSLFLD